MEIYARVLRCSDRGGLSPEGKSPVYQLDPPMSPRPGMEAPDGEPFQSVQVKIELGHKATVRKKRTADGFTHDWSVFVRGPEGSNIQHFVEKVVMHLHDSFPRPKRVLKEPPYQVTESGYAGFNLPVEIYFKNKEEPRKILFKYDLFLHNEGCPPVNHIRCEKLTFQNPTEEFRRKLIKAGGVGVPGPNDHAQYKPTSATATATATTVPAVPQVPPTVEGKAFTDLFGAPLYKQDARKKQKSKEKSSKGKNGTSPTETPSPTSASSSQNKAPSSQSKEKPEKSSSSKSGATVSSASSYKSKSSSGAGVIPSKEKTTLKRPAESSPSSSDGAKKRRSKDDEKEHSKEKKHKSSHSHHKSHSSSKNEKKKSTDTNGDSSKTSLQKPAHLQQNSTDSNSGGKGKKTLIDLSDGELSSSSDEDDVVVTEVEASPASSGNKNSFSNGGGPLGKLWDEIEQDEEMLSPLPKSSPSQFFSQRSPSPCSPEKPKSRANGTNDYRLSKVSPSDITNQAAPNGETFAMLLDLQRRLLSVTDKDLLHKIVRIIQDTQLYQISDSTFDFDLCSLDSKTVGKLQNFLNTQVS